MRNFIGISLRISTIQAGRLNGSGEPVLMPDRDGELDTPTAVWFEGPGNAVTGKYAKAMFSVGSDVHTEFLRDMGSPIVHETPYGTFTPSDLCALVLKDVVSNIRQSYGDKSDITITMPPAFSDAARKDITRAATLSGVGSFTVIAENIAEAIYLRHKYGLKDGKYLTLKFGYGSSDATVFAVDGTNLRILSSSGLQRLGHVDFTSRFAELICQKYTQLTGEHISSSDLYVRCQLTRWDLEQAILTLASREKVCLAANTPTGKLRIEIIRHEFKEAVRAILDQVEFMMNHTTAKAKTPAEDLDGSFISALPLPLYFLAESMRALTRKVPSDHPDGAAALGAALYSAALAGREKITPAQQVATLALNVQDVTPSFLGIQEFDQVAWKLRNRILIPKGEPIPTSRKIELTADESGRLPKVVLTESTNAEEDVDFVVTVMILEPTNVRPRSKHTLTVGFDLHGCAYAHVTRHDDGGQSGGYMEPTISRK